MRRKWQPTPVFLGFPGSSVVKNLPAMQETQVRSLGWEDPLEEEMATQSSPLTWEIPRTEDRLQSMVSQRVRHELVTKQQSCWRLRGPWTKVRTF